MGQGFDVHRLVEGRPLILAGVDVPHARGLDGHSDADVVAHAVADALLGALGIGDLGRYFPSSEPEWKGASGAVLLAPILERMRHAGWRIGNVDTTIVAQEPRLAAHVERLCVGLADQLKIERARVNIKLKSTDGLGSIGRAEGIAAQAVVLLESSE